jgi:hypothetical protein
MAKKRRNRGRKNPSLNDLSRELPGPDDWPKFHQELLSQTDRGAVLIGGSLVDSTLRLALQCKMIEMTSEHAASIFEGPDAPLGSFAGRIKVARAVGIFGPNLEARLNTIRQIRNQFAHAMVAIDLSHELFVRECEKAFPLVVHAKWPLPADWTDTRIRFVSACYEAADYLVGWSINNGGGEIKVDDVGKPGDHPRFRLASPGTLARPAHKPGQD